MFTNSTKDIQHTQRDFEHLMKLNNIFQDLSAFIDSTSEQQIPRPKDKRRRDSYYSGKKKRHTVKTQLMVNNHGFIIHKTYIRKEEEHDYDIYKENHPVIPKRSC